MGRFCLQCDDGTQLQLGIEDKEFVYKGRKLIVPAIHGWHCPVCGECEFVPGEHEGVRYSAAIDSFCAEVDVQESADLSRIRKRLKLTQKEAAEIAGGGVNAFSRYERGKARPVAAVINLFRLLDKHPELLNELRPG